jgi:hypothetical protein
VVSPRTQLHHSQGKKADTLTTGRWVGLTSGLRSVEQEVIPVLLEAGAQFTLHTEEFRLLGC